MWPSMSGNNRKCQEFGRSSRPAPPGPTSTPARRRTSSSPPTWPRSSTGPPPTSTAIPAVFFRNSYPTRGMKELLKAVCLRLSGQGGEIGSIIRLDTQYGGGKTHGLIALVHAVRGMKGVENVAEFVDPALLPKGQGPRRGARRREQRPRRRPDPRRRSAGLQPLGRPGLPAGRGRGLPAGRGQRQEAHRPGAETLRELFGGEPTLIMIDEVSVYLRKVERAIPGASDQFTAFLQALFKAVESSPERRWSSPWPSARTPRPRMPTRRSTSGPGLLAEAEKVAARKATHPQPDRRR